MLTLTFPQRLPQTQLETHLGIGEKYESTLQICVNTEAIDLQSGTSDI